MRKTRYRHTVVTLLLMTFAGQALASALSCCESLPFRNTGSAQLEHPISGLSMPGAYLSGSDVSGSGGLANDLITDKPMLADSSACTASAKASTIDHSSHQVSQPASDNWHSLTLLSNLDSASAAECSPDCDCSAGSHNPAPISASQAVFSAGFIAPESGYTSQPLDQFITALFRPPISR